MTNVRFFYTRKKHKNPKSKILTFGSLELVVLDVEFASDNVSVLVALEVGQTEHVHAALLRCQMNKCINTRDIILQWLLSSVTCKIVNIVSCNNYKICNSC